MATTSATQPAPLQNIHHHVTLKLTRENYPIWKVAIVPFLEGPDLFRFVDGSYPRPQKCSADPKTATLVPNPDHQTL